MTKAGTAYIEIEPDLSGFDRKISSEVSKGNRRWAKYGAGVGKALAGGVATAGVAGIAAVTVEVKRSVDAFHDSNKVAKQTQAVLKSTDHIAGTTAKSIGALATAISRKTGIDDEAVQSAENVLSTFTEVRNETGRGNKIFDQATRTITDMSVALGQDLKGSTIQVGKALNDPIKGITALSRVGVSFTAQQKDQIKTLVDSGNKLKAQKIILRELNREFGGSAEAQATAGAKLKVELGNIEELIGRGISPAVDVASKKLTHLAIDAQPELTKLTTQIGNIFHRKDLDLAGKLTLSKSEVRKTVAPILPVIGDELGSLKLGDKLEHAIDVAAPAIAEGLAHAAPHAASRFVHAFVNTDIWGQLLIGGLLLKKMGGLGAFTALGRRAGGAMGKGMAESTAAGAAASGAGGAAAGAGAGAAGGAVSKLLSRVPKSLKVAGGTAGAIAALKIGSDFLRGYAKADAAVKVFGGDVDRLVKQGDKGGLKHLSDQIRQYADANQGSFSDSGKAARQYADDVEHALDKGSNAQAKARKNLAGMRRDLAGNWALIGHDSKESLQDVAENVKSNGSLIRQRLGKDTDEARKATSQNFREAAQAIRTSMKAGEIDTEKGSRRIKRYLVDALMSMGLSDAQARSKLSSGTLQTGARVPGQATDPGRQRGGIMTGGEPSGDSIRAVLERGEYVLNREAVKKIGHGTLDAINFRHAPRFQKGGGIGAPNFGPHPSNVTAGISRLISVMQSRFPLAVSSTTDHGTLTTNGNVSDHVSGHAVDLTAASEVMSRASEWVKSSGLFRTLKQGIHNPNLSVNAGAIVPTSYWGPTTWAQHASHIHMALAGALSGFTGKLPQVKAAWSTLGGGPGALANQALMIDHAAAQSVVKRVAQTLTSAPDAGNTSAGGTYDKAALRRLWVRAGGNPSQAGLMAAIALAESGGNPGIVNSIGATGLWQIHPGGNQYLNPLTNAKTAVAKLGSQGLSAWEAYTDGGYRQYLQKGGAVGGGLRARQHGWMQSMWSRIAPLFGESPGTPVDSLVSDIKFDRSLPFVGMAWDPGKEDQPPELDWPAWLFKGKHKLDHRALEQLFIHEMAHRFQDPEKTGSAWKAEGGAQAFAWDAMDRLFGGRKVSAGDPYNAPARRVEKTFGDSWVMGGQFKVLAHIAKFLKGGAVRGPSEFDRQFPSHHTGDAAGHTRFSGGQVRRLAELAGLPGAQFEAIAHGESDDYPGIISSDQGYGLWQMTPRVWGADRIARMNELGGASGMLNPWHAALMARYLYSHAGNSFSDWKGSRYLSSTAGAGPLGNITGARKSKKVASFRSPATSGRHRRTSIAKAIAQSQLKDPRQLVKRIRELGLPEGLADGLTRWRRGVALDAEGASRADLLTTSPDTTGLDDLTTEELQGLARQRGIDPTGLNRNTLLARLEDDVPGVYDGKTQAQWITRELTHQLKLRNTIIRARISAALEGNKVQGLITQSRTRLAAASESVSAGKQSKRQLERQLAAAEKHPKGNKDLIKSLKGQIGDATTTVNTRTKLRDTIKDKIMPALTDKASKLDDLQGSEKLLGELRELQGIGSPMTIMRTLPAAGVLGGTILDNQLTLAELTKAKPTIADDTADPDPDVGSGGEDLWKQIAEQYRLRYETSERQADIFRQFPYAGKFHQGGIVPGAAGQESVAILEARERIMPADTPVIRMGTGRTIERDNSSDLVPIVHVHVHDGAVDSRKIEAVVERVSRQQALHAGRALPSRGGGLFR
jgi:hypothetical protein